MAVAYRTLPTDHRPVRSGTPKLASDRTQPVGPVVVAIALLAGLFLLHSSPWLGARFGESHDGRNAATWAAGSRAIRDEGVIASGFGGRYEGDRYASHPPGILAETTLVESIAGEHRLVTRSPAWIGSVAAIALTGWLLVELGLSALATSAALAVTFSSPMFLVYGSMLDTPVTSLPFALAIVLAGQRAVDGRAPRPVVLALLGLLAALSGWLALGFAMVQAGRLGWRAWRGRGSWASARAIGLGATGGLGITVTWIWWVYGSFDTMANKAQDKTTAVSLVASLTQQLHDLEDLYLLAAIAGVAAAVLALVALPDRRWRGLFGSTALPVVAYAVVFRGGAQMHQYWNYAALVPLAIAIGAGVQVVRQRVPVERRSIHQGAIATAAVLLALVASSRLSDSEAELRNALGTPALLDRAAAVAPPGGPVVAYLSPPRIESPWVSYEAERPGLALHRPAALSALARRDPAFPVLVPWVTFGPQADEVVRSAYAVEGPYAVAPARVVARARAAR